MIPFMKLVISGVIGSMPRNATYAEIVSSIGEPEIHTPARKSYPEMLVYGELEFRLRDGHLTVATLSIEGDEPELPSNVQLSGLPRRRDRSLESIKELLGQNAISYKRDAVMSDESQDVLVTEVGVHLVFVDQQLVRIGVESLKRDPET